MICTSCGAENRPGRRFCRACGRPLAVGCPACGGPFEDGDRFCGVCGTARELMTEFGAQAMLAWLPDPAEPAELMPGAADPVAEASIPPGDPDRAVAPGQRGVDSADARP